VVRGFERGKADFRLLGKSPRNSRECRGIKPGTSAAHRGLLNVFRVEFTLGKEVDQVKTPSVRLKKKGKGGMVEGELRLLRVGMLGWRESARNGHVK